MPADADPEAMVMFSDILPTGFECGVLNGKVAPGGSVAAGPVGLAALLPAQFYAPSQIIAIDLDDNRVAVAKAFGATDCINSGDGKAVEAVIALTGGIGVDTAIEAVGVPETFELCADFVAPGGTLANVGVHGAPAMLHLERLWDRNLTITTRLVDTASTPMLLSLLAGRIDATRLITQRFMRDTVIEAYEVFAHAADTKALKVIIAVEARRPWQEWLRAAHAVRPRAARRGVRAAARSPARP